MRLQKIDGYVAFLDILGFTEHVTRSSFDAEFARYSDVISATAKSSGNLNYVTFSDKAICAQPPPE